DLLDHDDLALVAIGAVDLGRWPAVARPRDLTRVTAGRRGDVDMRLAGVVVERVHPAVARLLDRHLLARPRAHRRRDDLLDPRAGLTDGCLVVLKSHQRPFRALRIIASTCAAPCASRTLSKVPSLSSLPARSRNTATNPLPSW